MLITLSILRVGAPIGALLVLIQLTRTPQNPSLKENLRYCLPFLRQRAAHSLLAVFLSWVRLPPRLITSYSQSCCSSRLQRQRMLPHRRLRRIAERCPHGFALIPIRKLITVMAASELSALSTRD